MAILASDNFTRANSADLGTNWDENTADPGTGGFDIVSNTASVANTGLDCSETYNAVSSPNDQYSECTFGATTADGLGVGCGVVCRSAVAARTYYRVVGCGSGYELGRSVAGTFTSLSSGAGTTFAVGDKLRLTVKTNGANADWALLKNGVQFASGTDTSPIASGRFGIGYSSSAPNSFTLTAWEGGDFGSAIAGSVIGSGTFHPGASPGLGGISSARFQPSNWWPYSPPAILTFDPAFMLAMEKHGNDPLVLPPQVVASGMTPPEQMPT